MASRQHIGRQVAGKSGGLADERKPCLGYTQADPAATSQPTSGQPYSAAKVVTATMLPIPSRMELYRRRWPFIYGVKDYRASIALGGNSVSTDTCTESSFSLSSSLLLL